MLPVISRIQLVSGIDFYFKTVLNQIPEDTAIGRHRELTRTRFNELDTPTTTHFLDRLRLSVNNQLNVLPRRARDFVMKKWKLVDSESGPVIFFEHSAIPVIQNFQYL